MLFFICFSSAIEGLADERFFSLWNRTDEGSFPAACGSGRDFGALSGISTVRIEEDTHTPVSGGKYLSFMSLQEEVGAKLLLAFNLSVDIS